VRHNLALKLTGTGLDRPGLRTGWVDRYALVQRLTATEARLILVEAPAGYGKTTLVAQWRARMLTARSFAGISLDQADNKPRTLWRHITQALLRACPELDAEHILRQLRVISPDITGTVIPLLVNELAALAAPAVLVLDDYHSISEPDCHDQVTFLLNHLPASVQVVLVTRADPPLPLARWRANGEMAEFRAGELRFTEAEVALVVPAVSGLELSESGLARLVELTEGWPTGLYLAARSLPGHHSPAAFVRRFTGASPVIADFMAEEVLGRQPAAIRRFLARTSILARFCAPLCDAVTESADGVENLAILERANAFIVPLDETRQWFRYHHLFAQVLRHELERTEPGIIPVLHRRASEWFRRSGSATAAIDHAIAGGDRAGAIDLIAANWYAQAASGQAATVRGWVRKLDQLAIGTDPVAAHCAAWSAAMSGDRESVRRWLPVMAAAARKGTLPDGTRSLESSVALLQGFCGFDGLESMSDSAERAAELESDASSPWYAVARTALGFSRYLCGDAAGAEGALLEAVAGEVRPPQLRLLSLSALSLTVGELDQLERAHHAAGLALSCMISRNLSQTPPASLAFAAAGAAHAGLGRLHEARGELEYALDLRRRIPGISVWATIDIMLRLAMVLVDVADRSSAAALAAEARLLLAGSPGEARALRARLRQLEQRLEGRPRALRLADPLTDREVMVLQLLRSALPLREIAAVQDLSVNTIKTQVRSIYRKLGVSARCDAVTRGRQVGLL
jgi:LuxR family transcriptional regulator, maltose regulon positive regulatory protein